MGLHAGGWHPTGILSCIDFVYKKQKTGALKLLHVVEVCEEPLDTGKETFSLCKQTQSRCLRIELTTCMIASFPIKSSSMEPIWGRLGTSLKPYVK